MFKKLITGKAYCEVVAKTILESRNPPIFQAKSRFPNGSK